ncbi:MAG: hypothetical protein LUE27_08495 [Clostridia bacterium]|nr:hypothetical protein [Clostridia bacterium]
MKKMKISAAIITMGLMLCLGLVFALSAWTASTFPAFADDDMYADDGKVTTTATVSTWDGSSTDDSWVTAGTTEEDVTTYEISSAAQLAYLAEYVNGGNSLSGDIVNLTVNVDLGGYTWTTIGKADIDDESETITENTGYPFEGTFDGGNYTISNLTNTSGDDTLGLFGFVQGATIENINVENVKLKGSQGVGTIVGWADYPSIATESTISNCNVTGTVAITGYYSVGGILGCGERSTVTDCSVTATEGSEGYIEGVWEDDNRIGDNVGGIIGFLGVTQNTGLISRIYNLNVSYVKISGIAKVGGILGSTDVMGTDDNPLTLTTSDSGTTTVTSCTVSITKKALYDDVYGDQTFVGATVGQSNFDMTIENCSISDITVEYYNEDCVYGGSDHSIENAGYYGGSKEDGVFTLTDCTGAATLTKI